MIHPPSSVSSRWTLSALATFGIVVPTVISVVAFVLVQSWIPDLPNPVAIHWGGSGGPNGFGSPTTYLAMIVLAGWILPLVMSVPAIPFASRGRYSPVTRFMVATSVWLSLFMGILAVGSVSLQRGLTDAADAPGVGMVLLAGLGISTAAGVITYVILPKPDPLGQYRGQPIPPLPLEPGHTAAWSSRAIMTSWITVPILVMAAGSVVFALFTASVDHALPWILVGTAITLLLLVFFLGAFHVSVGRQGVSIRSYAGWPRLRIPLEQIDSASVVNISPIAETGGWGWRLIPGRGLGVITRSGSALQVTRDDDRILLVTVDDAQTGASVLAALLDRQRGEQVDEIDAYSN